MNVYRKLLPFGVYVNGVKGLTLLRLFLSFLFLSVSLSVLHCQEKITAGEVLDRTYEAFVSSDGISTSFRTDLFVSGDLETSTSGTMLMRGEKFFFDTEQVSCWFDGETQWTLVKQSQEVNITSPTLDERKSISPFYLIGLYKQGYKLSMGRERLRGVEVFEVRLKQNNRDDLPKDVILSIKTDDFTPMCIRARMKTKTEWTRITLYDYVIGRNLAENAFRFESEAYPGVEVVDLR